MKHTIAVLLIAFSMISSAAEDNKENRPPSPPMPSPFVRSQEDIDAIRAYLDRQVANRLFEQQQAQPVASRIINTSNQHQSQRHITEFPER